MVVTISRKSFSPNSTQGVMSPDDGSFGLFTLEPSLSSGKLVPAGTYKAYIAPTYRESLRQPLKEMGLPFETPHLEGIAGPIEFHIGNYPSETEGCALVGKSQGEDSVGRSRDAFKELMAHLPPEFTVIYEEPAQP